MSGVVLNADGRAVIFDRALGRVHLVSVPTALENVANSKGQIVHGETGPEWDGEPVESPVGKPIDLSLSSTELVEDNVLPLPAGEVGIKETAVVAPAEAAAPAPSADAVEAPSPLDHDGDGKPGGSVKRAAPDPERVALFAALDAKGVKYFKGSSTDKLKALLARS